MQENKKEKTESTDASFYRAYCNDEGKWLGQWNADEQVAINSKNHHERNNAGHNVTIEQK